MADLPALVAAAVAVDGVAPLSEHALLRLRTDAGARSRHLVVRAPGTLADGPGALTEPTGAAAAHAAVMGARVAPDDGLAAVATVDLGEGAEPVSAELVVRPDRRRLGLGSALLRAAEELAGASPLRVWAHGDLPAARALAVARGYQPVRGLWQMTRSLADPLPDVEVPAGFTLRSFRPGVDDEGWLAVNAAAFAHHPEQGAWRATDLEQRMAEPWFDPAGFLLLVDDATGELAGFHWTKVHPADEHAAGSSAAGADAVAAGFGGAGDDGRVGEVYVVGVAPDFQGRGLAKPLTLAGLQHLRDGGLSTVILYVDGDNDAAVRTYSGLGFTRSSLDVQYARQLLP